MTPTPDRLSEVPGEDAGGDPVCWVHLLCPECGAVPDDPGQDRCERCGAELPVDDR